MEVTVDHITIWLCMTNTFISKFVIQLIFVYQVNIGLCVSYKFMSHILYIYMLFIKHISSVPLIYINNYLFIIILYKKTKKQLEKAKYQYIY